MELAELLLKRGDIPISEDAKNGIIVLIHPDIFSLPEEIRTDRRIGLEALKKADEMFVEDLENYRKFTDNYISQRQRIDKILKIKPVQISKIFPSRRVIPSYKSPEKAILSFVLYSNTELYTDFGVEILGRTNLIGERFKEYCLEGTFEHEEREIGELREGPKYSRRGDIFYIDEGKPWVKIFDISGGKVHTYHGEFDCYLPHNVENLTDSFMLRDWSMVYVNDLLQRVKR